VVQDFNYRKANLENSFKADEPVDSKGEGTYMYWGYNLRDLDEAQRLSKVRSQEFLCQQAVIKASSTAIDVRSGYSIDLKQHFQKAINKSYLVTSVKHHARQSYAWFEPGKSATDAAQQGTFYTCEFEAVDEALQYRPARKTKWPFVSGTLSGIIDDEGSGKYAQLNDYGQYKVQLLFDLSEQNTNRGSSWIRMMTPYAGQGHGMAFPLLKGTEVIIGFMGGDPDQPIILGAVPNSENPNVLNSDNAYLGGFQSDSGNYMVVNDLQGEEGIQMWSPGGDTHLFIGRF
jgi:type VI secretion system secreted protein VgrG